MKTVVEDGTPRFVFRSPYQIMRSIFDQLYFGDRLFCENL